MISIKNLLYIYEEDNLVLDDISLEIYEGDFLGILGKNGAGKSTLLSLILGIRYPTKGEIKILGKISNTRTGEHLKEVVYLSQDITLLGSSTVEQFLYFHSKLYAKYSKKIEEEMLSYFQLDAKAKIGSLSTGQQKKAQIVAALSSDTKILIIDELTAVLDPETRHHLFLKLRELNVEKKKTIILATNIAEDLTKYATKILFISNHKGEVVEPEMIHTLFNLTNE